MAPSTTLGSPLAALLSGSLNPQVTLISDSVVQPGAVLLRELLQRKSDKNESVCLLCCENDPARLLPLNKVQSNLSVIDCLNDREDVDTQQEQRARTFYTDIDDLANIEKLVSESGKTTLVIDSLNALEMFNGTSSIYRFLKRTLGLDVSLLAVHHTDSPTSPSVSTSTQLLPSLLSPSFATSLLHFTLHPPALLAHLHYSYSIEHVGQQPGSDVAAGTYDFLPRLHARHWASPLHPGEHSRSAYEDIDTGSYDSPGDRDVILDLLNTKGSQASRCIVEYSMRGINKSNKRSEAAKIARGLEGLRQTDDILKSLVAEDVSGVLRIKSRQLAVQRQPAEENKQAADPTLQSMFNLSLTDRQREAREGVELPYTPKDGGEILYQPDSADDMDESDPDEDLDL